MKLNVQLAKRQHSQSIFKKLLSDTLDFFRRKESPFQGFQKTYTPRGDYPIDYQYVGNKRVVSTVGEKMDYFEKHSGEYINNMLAVEATNATAAKAELIVDGLSFGMLSTMELLALKSFVESKDFVNYYEELPVRSEVWKWTPSTDSEHNHRDIYTTDPIIGEDKTSEVTPYILQDPNVELLVDKSKYVPVQASKRVDIIKGDKRAEIFSGELAIQDRAEMLARRSKFYEGILEAIEKANLVEVVESQCTAQKLFDYIRKGK